MYHGSLRKRSQKKSIFVMSNYQKCYPLNLRIRISLPKFDTYTLLQMRQLSRTDLSIHPRKKKEACDIHTWKIKKIRRKGEKKWRITNVRSQPSFSHCRCRFLFYLFAKQVKTMGQRVRVDEIGTKKGRVTIM